MHAFLQSSQHRDSSVKETKNLYHNQAAAADPLAWCTLLCQGLPASALRGRHQLPSSGEMHKPHRPAAPAPARTLDVPIGRIHPLPLHGQHDELVGGEIKLTVLLLR